MYETLEKLSQMACITIELNEIETIYLPRRAA